MEFPEIGGTFVGGSLNLGTWMDFPGQGSGFEGEDSGWHHGVQEPKP